MIRRRKCYIQYSRLNFEIINPWSFSVEAYCITTFFQEPIHGGMGILSLYIT